MNPLLLKLRTWWETADRTQKTVTIFGSIFLVALIAGTFVFAGRPKMDVLFRELTPADQGMVAAELTKLSIPFEQDRNGGISVPSDKVAEVQGKLAVANKMPSSGHAGNNDLSTISAMTTPNVEREKLKTIVEGELAKSIESIEGVTSARVHLTLGESSPFAREVGTSSASVIVGEKAEGAIGPEQAKSIQKMVQFAVQGLQAKNITVINSHGRTLIDGSDMIGGGSGIAMERIQSENAEARKREALLQQKLDTVFGRGNTVVSIPVCQIDFDQKNSDSTERLPTKPVVIEKSTESMGSGAGPGVGGAAGTVSNTPNGNGTPATVNAADNKAYTGVQEAKTFETSETRTSTVFAAGELKKLAINVLVNSTNVKDTTKVEDVVKGELGPLAADKQNFATTVTALAFDTTAAEEAKKNDAAAQSANSKQQLFSLIPVIALVAVAFVVIKAIAKASQSSNVLVAALPDGSMIPLSVGEVIIEENGTQKTVAATSNEALQAAREGRVVGSTNSPIIRHPEAGLLDGATPQSRESDIMQFIGSDETVKISKIPDHINIPLEQIKKMAQERPDTTAMLLKSWLLSDK